MATNNADARRRSSKGFGFGRQSQVSHSGVGGDISVDEIDLDDSDDDLGNFISTETGYTYKDDSADFGFGTHLANSEEAGLTSGGGIQSTGNTFADNEEAGLSRGGGGGATSGFAQVGKAALTRSPEETNQKKQGTHPKKKRQIKMKKPAEMPLTLYQTETLAMASLHADAQANNLTNDSIGNNVAIVRCAM